jgi:hypothetical protein
VLNESVTLLLTVVGVGYEPENKMPVESFISNDQEVDIIDLSPIEEPIEYESNLAFCILTPNLFFPVMFENIMSKL